MIYSLYRLSTTLCAPLIDRYLKKRLAKGKEDPARFSERQGRASAGRPKGKLIWLHGASVGEAISLLALIDRLQKDLPHWHILMTTGTVTSAELMKKRLPKGVIHQFVPVDRLPYVKRFLDHWHPDVALWSESELWPNLLVECRKRSTKMALINARMSERSFEKWSRFKGFIQQLLGTFDLCLAQTEKDGENYRKLGAQNVHCLGNLKYAAPELPFNPTDFEHLRTSIQGRPIWLAASTHAGEETLIARVHKQVKKDFPDLLTLIAPRHAQRGDDIASELVAQGLNVIQRSKGALPDKACDIYLCDTMGEMGLLYRLSDLVFMGKSMDPLGGQNPLEPARLSSAVLCGPHMTNFTEIMDRFIDANCITIVQDETELTENVSALLKDKDKTQELAEKAKEVACSEAAVLDRLFDKLSDSFQLGKGGQ